MPVPSILIWLGRVFGASASSTAGPTAILGGLIAQRKGNQSWDSIDPFYIDNYRYTPRTTRGTRRLPNRTWGSFHGKTRLRLIRHTNYIGCATVTMHVDTANGRNFMRSTVLLGWSETITETGTPQFRENPDGSKILHLPDGTDFHDLGDGSGYVVHPSGDVYAWSPEGQVVYIRPDGSSVTTSPEGTSTLWVPPDLDGIALDESGNAFTDYNVQSGDSLSQIAEQFNTTVEKFLAANPHIENPNVIVEGDTLRIPTELPPGRTYEIDANGELEPDTYVVEKGDTLSDVAVAHGVSVQDVIDINPQIQDPNLIRPGDEVRIPVPDDVVQRFEAQKKSIENFWDGKAGTLPQIVSDLLALYEGSAIPYLDATAALSTSGEALPLDQGLLPDFSGAESLTSPIIVDLDGDGVETTSRETGPYFDHDA